MTTPPLHEQIRARRLELGLTQEQAAARAGLQRTHWNAYETGKLIAGAKTRKSIAYALDCTIELALVPLAKPCPYMRESRSK